MSTSAALAFDHLVVMLRDQLETTAPRYEVAGYTLSELSVHNLGSINRLIMLDTSYIELLGWPAGAVPLRKEIAGQPLGLDALVLRSEDATRDFDRLRSAGFDVQPVSRLERPLEIDGVAQMARFDTVRFGTQPVPGFRLYLCQHLTPEHVWVPQLMQHANGARSLEQIRIAAPDAGRVAKVLATVAGATLFQRGDRYSVELPNLELLVEPSHGHAEARIVAAGLRHADGSTREFNVSIT